MFSDSRFEFEDVKHRKVLETKLFGAQMYRKMQHCKIYSIPSLQVSSVEIVLRTSAAAHAKADFNLNSCGYHSYASQQPLAIWSTTLRHGSTMKGLQKVHAFW